MYLFLCACLISCSPLSFWRNESKNNEDRVFVLFDPYIKNQVTYDFARKHFCFNLRQVFRGTEYWGLCFPQEKKARLCYRKISRLQGKNRAKGSKKELYRPGEIVEIRYKLKRDDYRDKRIFPHQCLAYKTNGKHLIRSNKGLESWRLISNE